MVEVVWELDVTVWNNRGDAKRGSACIPTCSKRRLHSRKLAISVKLRRVMGYTLFLIGNRY